MTARFEARAEDRRCFRTRGRRPRTGAAVPLPPVSVLPGNTECCTVEAKQQKRALRSSDHGLEQGRLDFVIFGVTTELYRQCSDCIPNSSIGIDFHRNLSITRSEGECSTRVNPE